MSGAGVGVIEAGVGVIEAGVGVIGAGAMGSGIVARLLASGAAVWARDVDPAREADARSAGARIAATAGEIGRARAVAVVVVVDGTEVRSVLESDDGLLGALGPGKAVLVCSTIAPDEMERACRAIAATGAHAIDAPISGGPARARDGSMSVMLAAPHAALARVEPVLAAIAAKRFPIGERWGDATRAKLVNNLMAGAHLVAGAEALALAERVGLDPRAMIDLVAASSGQSWTFDDRMPRALAGDLAPRAQTRVLAKDLRLVNELARGAGVRLAVGELAGARFAQACEEGWSELDDASMLAFYRARFGGYIPE